MKAAQISAYGSSDVLQIADAPEPAIQPDQVLVKVAAAGINPFDISVREGHVKHMAELNFPTTLGGDFAGTISEVGTDVKGFKVGQEVYGQAKALSGHGSFAEYAPVPASQLALKPKSLDFISAGAVPLVAASAYQALVDHINLQSGQKILIHGGAGGIGSMAVQLAKHLGAHVSATSSGRDAEYVKELGADEVIDYEKQDFTTLIKDYYAVFDTVGGETTAKSYTVLKSGGALVSMAAKPDEALVAKYKINFTSQFTQTTTERLAKLATLFDNGDLKPQVDKVFPLDQVAQAMDYLKNDHPRGKVVLQIQ